MFPPRRDPPTLSPQLALLRAEEEVWWDFVLFCNAADNHSIHWSLDGLCWWQAAHSEDERCGATEQRTYEAIYSPLVSTNTKPPSTLQLIYIRVQCQSHHIEFRLVRNVENVNHLTGTLHIRCRVVKDFFLSCFLNSFSQNRKLCSKCSDRLTTERNMQKETSDPTRRETGEREGTMASRVGARPFIQV